MLFAAVPSFRAWHSLPRTGYGGIQSPVFWIPAFAGMTTSRQAVGKSTRKNSTHRDQRDPPSDRAGPRLKN